MPYSVSTLRCQLDADLDDALFAYQERLGNQLIAARSMLDDLRTLGTTITSEFSGPLRRDLDALLAVVGSSTDTLIDSTLLVTGSTPAEIEATVGDRFALTVVGGRVIPFGTTNLSAIGALARVLGGFEAIFDLAPELTRLVGSDVDHAVRPSSDISNFFLICTYIKKTITPATLCTPEIVVEEEITIGIDSPISSALASSGISLDQLRLYVFWLGRPLASADARAKALRLGLSTSQFVDAVSSTNRRNFSVRTILDPIDVARVSASFGSDASLVLGRLRGPITLFPSTDLIVSYLSNSLASSTPGSVGPTGLPDFSSPSLSLLSVLDVNKTFGLDDMAAALAAAGGETKEDAALAQALGNSIRSQLAVISTIVSEAQAVVSSVLNEVVALTSVVNMLLNDQANGLMDCMLGPTFSISSIAPVSLSLDIDLGLGTPGTPGASTSNPLEGILNTIESTSGLLSNFFQSLSGFAGAVSDMSCSGSFTSSSVTSLASSGMPFPCLSDPVRDAGFEIPPVTMDTLEVATMVMGLLTQIFDGVRTSLRGLRLTTNSLSLSLRLNLVRRNSSFSASSLPGIPGSPGCASPEAARLAALLVARSINGFTPPSL